MIVLDLNTWSTSGREVDWRNDILECFHDYCGFIQAVSFVSQVIIVVAKQWYYM